MHGRRGSEATRDLYTERVSEQTSTPPGWHPDPQDPSRQRWWDGARWTEHLHPAAAPAAPAAQQQGYQPKQQAAHYPRTAQQPAASYPQAAQQPAASYPQAEQYQPYSAASGQPGAPQAINTSTPWIWLIIGLPVLTSLFVLFYDWRGYIEASIESPTGSLDAMTSPGYLLIVLSGWLSYALCVLFAFLDMRTLSRRGLQRPFHWAWAFLSSAVYAIGRSVVAGSRTGRPQPTLWAAIGAVVLSLVIGIIVLVIVFSATGEIIGSSIPSS